MLPRNRTCGQWHECHGTQGSCQPACPCRTRPERVESDPGGSRERRTGPRHRRLRIRRGALHRAASRRGLPRAHDASFLEPQRGGAHDGARGRRGPDGPRVRRGRPPARRGMARGRRRRELRAARGIPLSGATAERRRRAHHAGPRGYAPGAASRARCASETSRADLVVRGGRLRHRPRPSVHRGGLDRPVRPEAQSLREVEDDGRAGRVGLHRPGGRRPRARGREPRRDLRSRARHRTSPVRSSCCSRC